ncbi:DNA (cytosine-5-)-methyltransferase [Rhizobium sp. AN80A]|uniref:DNA (cytosine-5-)-methyltransferase n=1 Tax=Rhizobium sp. AN80A TaxID=3040673 RepID=UPI0024B336A1|nr:DNA (cytosine-5-)-methyltransferase [Rhizobium sp. AN80A]
MSFKGWKFIDLFAGIGAFHLALKAIGADCVFASEIDECAANVYEQNHGLRPAGDITKISETDIPAHDILCAGFPCQAFSIGGRKLGFEDTRGTLFFEIVRIAKHHKPRVMFLENVRNLEAHDGGRTFAMMRQCLLDLGYCVHSKVLDASDYGSPQKRERIFIVALRDDIKLEHRFSWPWKTVIQYCVEDMLDLEIVKPMSQEFIPEKDFDGRKNRIARVGRFGNGGQGYRVYDPRGLGTTLCSGGGGGGANTGVYLVNGEPRTLTARECARISGFPEDFILHPRERQAIRQFGNSIVVSVLRAIIGSTAHQVYEFYRLQRLSGVEEALHGRQLNSAVLSRLSKLEHEPRDVAFLEPDGSGNRFGVAGQQEIRDFDLPLDDLEDGLGGRGSAGCQDIECDDGEDHDPGETFRGFHFAPPNPDFLRASRSPDLRRGEPRRLRSSPRDCSGRESSWGRGGRRRDERKTAGRIVYGFRLHRDGALRNPDTSFSDLRHAAS